MLPASVALRSPTGPVRDPRSTVPRLPVADAPGGDVSTHLARPAPRCRPSPIARSASPPAVGSAGLGHDELEQGRTGLLEVAVGGNSARTQAMAADVVELFDRLKYHLVDVGVRDVDLGVGRTG